MPSCRCPLSCRLGRQPCELPGVALLLLVGALVGCRTSGNRPPLPSSLAPTPEPDMPVAVAFAEEGSLFVPARTVYQAVQGGIPIVFLDARPPLDFNFSRIPNAINVPYYEPEKHLDRIPRDRWLVAYCECPHAEAQQLADFLIEHGFRQVRVIWEGLQGWQDLGGPTVAGPAAGSSSAAADQGGQPPGGEP